MDYSFYTIKEYLDALSSKEPVPGGGGASAVSAAVGMALGNMVGSLTVGKKKYQDVEERMQGLMDQCARLQEEFLLLAEQDARCFAPLAKAYGLPKETEEEKAHKAAVLEEALRNASLPPMEILQKCREAIEVTEEIARIGTPLAVSDAGAAASLIGGAARAAVLNVYINTRSMADRETADRINREAMDLETETETKAEELYASIQARLCG